MSWIQSNIHQSVTLLSMKFGDKIFYGTGFFYGHTKENTLGKTGFIDIEKIFLITAKHCLYNKDDETNLYDLCDELKIRFTFFHDNKASKLEIIVSKIIIEQNLFKHKNDDVDIIALDLTEMKIQFINNVEKPLKHLNIKYILRNNLPNYSKIIDVDVTSDIIVYGFPYGYYDETNLFPLCKSGIIASGWNLNFNDDPMFLIDVQLFEISSGSPVISKPTNFVIKNNQIFYNNDQQYILLGVYTGEKKFKMIEKAEISVKGTDEIVNLGKYNSLGFGIVYYSYLIEEIIAD
jgi:V8-like Glu-specific endopeptidase